MPVRTVRHHLGALRDRAPDLGAVRDRLAEVDLPEIAAQGRDAVADAARDAVDRVGDLARKGADAARSLVDSAPRSDSEPAVDLPCLGIDLGTTFSAVAVIGSDGEPVVIPNKDKATTTPSIVWFNGNMAQVGRKADLRKDRTPQQVFEFVKRNIGRPVEVPEHLLDDPDHAIPALAPYAVGGYKYGPEGISALILSRLKKDALQFFRREGLIERDADDEIELDAVITVPAYYGDVERQQTRMAGYAAGLRVRAIINEPTAAALTYGISQTEPRRLLVFDLGGGTFDVTILETGLDGSATVIATEGDHNLGGYNIDEKIAEYLLDEYEKANGASVPEDQMHEVWTAAREAKLALSDSDEAYVDLAFDEGELQATLYRAREDAGEGMADFMMDFEDDTFYFEDRIQDLLQRCRIAADRALDEAASHPSRGGRALDWADIDEVVLTGGSCRIPAVRTLLAQWTGRPVRRTDQFDLDTAVAIGAALYGTHHRDGVSDVLSQTVGIEIVESGRRRVDPVLLANTPLPAAGSRVYDAPAKAMVVVREGDAEHADEAVERGRLHLGNPATRVSVTLRADEDGILTAQATWDDTSREVPIRNELFDFDQRAVELRERIAAVRIQN